MPFYILIRRAVKRVKGEAFQSNVAELNKSGDCKFLAIADVEVTIVKEIGVTGRPSLLNDLKEKTKAALGRNKRVFVAVETQDGEILLLLLYPQEIDKVDNFDTLLEGARLDTGFATDRGVSVLTAVNTVVKRKEKDVFVLEPSQSYILKRETFELKVVVVDTHKDSQSNAAATCAWLEKMGEKQ